uniref:Uncharacterized protein n=1 Tax=Balaenoptera musculus TaxID=9771 RepID=A0A8C0DZ97_BALMU
FIKHPRCITCNTHLLIYSLYGFANVPSCLSSNMSGYPRKPMTSYVRFSKEQLPIIKSQNPGASLVFSKASIYPTC